MLPLRDTNRPFTKPVLVYVLIAANVAVFLFQLSLPKEELSAFLHEYGTVPATVSSAVRGREPLLPAVIIPVFASLFLHGGWLHLLGNMWFLHIFGNNIEDAAGRGRFILFYLICGALANMAQVALNPASEIPIVGASGAIAGILGAYLLLWPRAKILTLVPIFYFIAFINLPAMIVLGFWFIIELFRGVSTLGMTGATGGIAYGAHVAGFICGMILIKILPLKRPPPPGARRGRR